VGAEVPWLQHDGAQETEAEDRATKPQRLAEKIRKTLREARGGSLKGAIERLNPVLRGWVAYFRLTEVKGVLEELDGWIRRKLRALLWRQWKRVYTRVKNLMRAAIDRQRA
jgi:RNA-directed DNA polymerase